MMPDLGTTHAGEELLSPVRASTIETVCLFMVDALHLEAAMQVVPRAGFVGVDHSARLDAGLDE